MFCIRRVSRYLRAGSNHSRFHRQLINTSLVSSSSSMASVFSESYPRDFSLFNGFRDQIHFGATSHLEGFKQIHFQGYNKASENQTTDLVFRDSVTSSFRKFLGQISTIGLKEINFESQPLISAYQFSEQFDPFSLVADELSVVANRLRDMVVAEVPKLASAAEYFFKIGLEGKRFRPTVLLLMATALNMPMQVTHSSTASDTWKTDLRSRQQSIAEITEMIHVASLLHDDVLDDAETRRGVGSLNMLMGNKLSVLAGDFMLSRACVALASLENTEVVSLLAQVVEHLVTGETMQMSATADQRCSMEYYMQKTFYKTASLISNSCKAVALLTGQAADVATLAYEYGKNLGLAFQLIDDVLDFTGTSASLGKGSLSDIRHGIVTAPILFAMEEFPQLREIVQNGFEDPATIDQAIEYLGRSHGLDRAKELAKKHASLAAQAIESLPESEDENVLRSRRALVELTHIVITRTK